MRKRAKDHEFRRFIAALQGRPTVIHERRDGETILEASRRLQDSYRRAKQLEEQYRAAIKSDKRMAEYRPSRKPSRLARALAWLVTIYAIVNALRFPPNSQ